jgi:hypothetical protein
MSIKIATAVMTGIIALAAAAAGDSNRNKDQTFKAAQYCVPNDDEPGAKSDFLLPRLVPRMCLRVKLS